MRGNIQGFVLFLVLTSLAASAAGANGVEQRAFTLDDLYRIRAVSDPQVSPDGTRIAFVAREYDLAKGKSESWIYRIESGGEGLRRLTGTGRDSHPRWSPDGKTLLFVSSRKDGSQIWLLPADGGEARQLTKISTGVSDPAWSPDGKVIVFASEVFPEFGADDEANRKLLDRMEKGPIQAHLADELLFRHWNFYKDGRRSHLLAVEIDSGKTRDLTPGDFDSPSFLLGGRGFDIAPDGSEVCFVSNRVANPGHATGTNKDLWVVPIEGGTARNLTEANEAFDGDPLYSPDGRFLAYRTQERPGFEADRFRIAVYDRKAGRSRTLADSFDNWVDDIAWSPDSRTLLFTGEVRGRVPLHRLDPATDEWLPIDSVPTVREFDLAPDGSWVAFTKSAIGEPYELWRADLAGGAPTRLTFFNREIEEEVDIRPAEEMWIPGADGQEVHVFLVKPHGFDPSQRYPLIVNVHGGPQSQWQDSFRGDWQVYPGAGYVVAFFNPHGSTGYGQAYTDAISRDWGGKVFEDVMRVTDALEKLPYVDPARIGAMGWSYGGYMMNWILGHTDRYEAIVTMMGVYDLRSMYGATEELWFPEWDLGGEPWSSDIYERFSPSNFVESFRTPTLILTGERDYRIPYTQSLQLFTALQKTQVASRLIIFKNDGHWPDFVKSMPLYYDAHLDWFHRYLGGDPAPYDVEKMVRNEAFEPEK